MRLDTTLTATEPPTPAPSRAMPNAPAKPTTTWVDSADTSTRPVYSRSVTWRMPASTLRVLTLTAIAAPTPALPSELAAAPATVASTLRSRAWMVMSRAATLAALLRAAVLA
ncbi:hypothetical protein G6F65_022921 [Rhizopus arrhizus]|nr:hypothetical protein G6F65_022921 [Rhizopus arrhizus]